MKRHKSFFLICVLNVIFINQAVADWVFTAPPRESLKKGIAQYKPIADMLSMALKEKVVYQHPKSWLHYQRDMRADKFDIVFDGPHFISWRIKRFGHTPVAKLPGNLRFIVVTSKNNTKINNLDDLVYKPICGIAPPNLATLSIQAYYKSPVEEPVLVTARRGGMKAVYKLFKQGKCVAAIFRDQFFSKKISESEKENLKVVHVTNKFSNQGISISNRFTEKQKKLITTALTQITGATKPTLKRFTPRAKKMINATFHEYDDAHNVITGVIYGWEIPKSRASRSSSDDDS